MRPINRSILVKAPSGFSIAYLKTYFLECGPQSEGAELSLRFPLPPLIIDGLTLEKRVHVSLHYGTDPDRHVLSIGWHAANSGPLPDFNGNVIATPDTADSCRLTITGTYAPPGGFAGLLFDRLIGVRISGATISALLEEFRVRIETDYRVRLVP